MSLGNYIAQYKFKFPKAQDPLDYLGTFGFSKIEKIVKESIEKNQEIVFKEEKQKITFKFKTNESQIN